MKTFFRNLSIQNKLLTGFGVIVLIMLVTGMRELIILNNLNEKRDNRFKAVRIAHVLKEVRIILNTELRIINEIYVAEKDVEIERGLEEHFGNRNKFSKLYGELQSLISDSERNKHNEANILILDSLEAVKDIYSNNLQPVIERIANTKKEMLNIEVYYAEYLRLQLDDVTKTLQVESKEDVKESKEEEVLTGMSYGRKIIIKMINKIRYGEVTSQNIAQKLEQGLKKVYNIKINETFFFVLTALIISIFIALFISRLIVRPVEKLRTQVEMLTSGNLPKDIYTSGKDEIGDMGRALDKLVATLSALVEFSIEIGKGNFTSDYTPVSRDDVLGNSLLSMRDSLRSAKEKEDNRKKEDLQRNRAAEGLTLFGDILRRYSEDISELSNEIISNLVKFTKSNQGAIFILNDEDKENIYLDLQAAYAYNRKKYLKRKIEPGVGLIGAVFLEKYSMYLTEVPDDFVEIESGFGGQNPKSILIVPLKIEEEVLGVVELASFSEFEPYEIELVERISESIASTLSTTRINARTAQLLQQSKNQAAKMVEQEEKMIATIQELEAVQAKSLSEVEDLRKQNNRLNEFNEKAQEKFDIQGFKLKQTELENVALKKQNKLNIALNNTLMQKSSSGILILDSNLNISKFNRVAETLLAYSYVEVKGKSLKFLLDDKYDQKLVRGNINNGLLAILDEKEISLKKRNGSLLLVNCELSKINISAEVFYVLLINC